jgi:PIN domain nuclease of toxin-antitoxin system
MAILPDNSVPTVVADTHALLWHLTHDERLSRVARNVFSQIDNGESVLIIPAVVLAELFMVVEKSRIALTPSEFRTKVSEWHGADNIHLTSLTPELVIQSAQLSSVPDIFDRLLVAETQVLGIPLITRDPVIISSQLVTVIW